MKQPGLSQHIYLVDDLYRQTLQILYICGVSQAIHAGYIWYEVVKLQGNKPTAT